MSITGMQSTPKLGRLSDPMNAKTKSPDVDVTEPRLRRSSSLKKADPSSKQEELYDYYIKESNKYLKSLVKPPADPVNTEDPDIRLPLPNGFSQKTKKQVLKILLTRKKIDAPVDKNLKETLFEKGFDNGLPGVLTNRGDILLYD